MKVKLKQAIKAVKSGDRKTAYSLLREIIEADPNSQYAEKAWLWMTVLFDDPEKKRKCLEKALSLNPQNEAARKGLQRLESRGKDDDTIESYVAEKTTPATSEKDQTSPKKKSPIVWIVLLLLGACCCFFTVEALFSSGYTSAYSVTLRAQGTAGQAYVLYGKSENTKDLGTVRLPWESGLGGSYGDTVAIVVGGDAGNTVTCEIWVDDELKVSDTSSPEKDYMAVCGFILGRNQAIRVVP